MTPSSYILNVSSFKFRAPSNSSIIHYQLQSRVESLKMSAFNVKVGRPAVLHSWFAWSAMQPLQTWSCSGQLYSINCLPTLLRCTKHVICISVDQLRFSTSHSHQYSNCIIRIANVQTLNSHFELWTLNFQSLEFEIGNNVLQYTLLCKK